MKTELAYLIDPYLKELESQIVDFEVVKDSEVKLILNKTVFYPMGGGQPTDQGTLEFSDGTKGDVYQVLLQNGEVWHYVKTTHSIQVGDNVKGTINWERRYRNMLIHSAGHVIDFAVFQLGLSPGTLSPQKGDHGKKPFIVYKGFLINDIKEELQNKVNETIANKVNFSWEFVNIVELSKKSIYLQPGLPADKPLRMLTMEGVGSVADGGTIVKNAGEIPGITIVSIETKDGMTTINYQLGMNNEKSAVNNQSDIKTEHIEVSEQTVLSDQKSDCKPLEIVNEQSERHLTVEQEQQKVADSILKTEIKPSTTSSEPVSENKSDLQQKISAATSEEDLTNLWREYLGKNGIITQNLKDIKNLPVEERKTKGLELNKQRNEIDEMINNKKAELLEQEKSQYLSKSKQELDFKKPKIGHLHPLTETINELNKVMSRIGYSVYDGPEIETYEYNFKRCNVPEDHPALDLQDSIYIKEPNILLRTQTSSIEAHALETLVPPYKIVMPGRVYRNEKVNKSNHFTFHQYQLVCVQEKVSMVELISTIEYVLKEVLGEDVETRYRNKYYPEVEPGLGPDIKCFNCNGEGCVICKHRGWIEIAGAGIIHPNIMKMAGLDTEKWQGYAFGFGLDRIAMARHNITDIRTLLGGNLAYMPNRK